MVEETPGPDRKVLRQKIEFLQESLRRLRSIRDQGRHGFLDSWVSQAAATRQLQVGIEAILDASHHVIAREGLGLPKTYRDAIDILTRAGILPEEKADDFSNMVRFRNRAVHLYDDIDPSEIWTLLDTRLGDFEIFIEAMVRRYFAPPTGS